MGKKLICVTFKHWGVLMGAAVLLFSLGVATQVMAADTADEASPGSDAQQMMSEREQFIKEIRRVENLNKKYTQEIDTLKSELADKEEQLNERLKKIEDSVAEKKQPAAPAQPAANQPKGVNVEEQTYNVLFNDAGNIPDDEKFREELAKAHYNMGNIFFERGEYQRAMVEYYQAVDLQPNDPDIHYNLAFVSGEFMGDQDTALKHYQWYLYLKPNASDAKLVQEKIYVAKQYIRSKIDSPLEKNIGNFNSDR